MVATLLNYVSSNIITENYALMSAAKHASKKLCFML
jgi:hypothetical protein